MTGGAAYTLPGQTDADGAVAEDASAVNELLPPGHVPTVETLAPIAATMAPPSRSQSRKLQPADDSRQGIGTDGWDGALDGKGDYENEAAPKYCSTFGDYGNNDSPPHRRQQKHLVGA